MQQIYRRTPICQSEVSIKLQNYFIGIILWYGCSPVNLMHVFEISFPKNKSGGFLLNRTDCQTIILEKVTLPYNEYTLHTHEYKVLIERN